MLFAERVTEHVFAPVPHRPVVFTVPKVLRKLFERERRLLSILPRCVHASIQALLREAVDDRHARVGTVASIQTFGSYAANFHPHVHALITEGAFHVAADGAAEFERVQWWDRKALNELFRRKVLRALRKAERLRPETEQMLLGWEHSGFSVHATEPVLPDDTDRLEHLARYITRASMRLDAIGRDWARLLRKIFEVDPMLCPQCGVKMLPVSVVQEVSVIDRILRHLW